MKRYSKLFAFAMIAFFASIVPTFAKTLTLEELEEKIDEDTNSFYMIGSYVFTDAHLLSTRDIMLASRSIVLTESAKKGAQTKDGQVYKEMTIYYVEREGDSWKEEVERTGTDGVELSEKFVITHIDYEPLPDDTKAEFTEDLGETYKTAFKDLKWEGNDETLEFTDDKNGKITVKGLVKYTPGVKYSSIQEENTGYYFALEMSVEGATDKTTLTTTTRTGAERVIPWSAWDTTDSDPKKIAILVAVSPTDNDKKITVTVDLDGTGEAYAPTTYTFDYSGVTFQEETKITVTTDLAEEAEKELKEAYGYVPNGKVTVSEITHSDDNLPVYKYSGEIQKQKLNESSGYTELEAGYITFSIKPENVQPGKTTVTIDKASNDDHSKTITMTDDELVFIRQVKKDGTNEIKITVDLDGTGDEYLPYSFYINYADVTVKESISTPEELDTATAAKLKSDFNYAPKAGTKVAFAQEGNKITATGTVMKDTTVTGFGEKTTGYYLAFSLVFDQKYDKIQITLPGRTDKIGFDSFDSDTEIGIIMQVNPQARSTNQFEIKVDKDGSGNDYQQETITVDYSKVKFSSVEVEKLPEESKTGFQNWMNNGSSGGSYTYNDDFTFLSEKDGVIKVTGEAKKHSGVTKYSSYQTDYYLVYVLKFDQKYDNIKITIEGRQNPITINDFDGGGGSGNGTLLTLVKPIKEEDSANKQIKLTIDLDGDSNNDYQPYELIIDWSEVTFGNGSE